MRIGVTGAGGFVGRHFCEYASFEIAPLDADVCDAEALDRAVAEARVNGILHLAAASSVAASWGASARTWEVNAVGTVNLLDSVVRHAPAARLVVVTSAEVYGHAGAAPLTEDAPVAPVSPYGASKAAAEIAAWQAHRASRLDIVVARPFPHIGPGQSERFAIGSWTRQVAELERAGGGTLKVGNLAARRDLIDVRDVVRAYAHMFTGAVASGTYNVAGGSAVQLSEVVEDLVALARCPIEIASDPERMRPSDLPVLCGDATRLMATGWGPTIPLARSLRDALDAARIQCTR